MSMKLFGSGRTAWPQALTLGFVTACCSLAFPGCGGDDGDDPSGGDGDAGDGDAGDGDGDISLGGVSGDGDAGDGDGDTVFGCNSLEVDDGCQGNVYEGESVPLDLYLMFDQSGSMATVVDKMTGVTRMEIVRSAIQGFLQDNESVGMGAGIGYFGHQPLAQTTCNVDEYRTPDVGIGVLPDNEQALIDSLAAREPTGETPTGSAIRGACEYVAEFRADNPTRKPIILLVTDGEPKAPLSEEVCAPTLDDAVAAAQDCSEQGTLVYVLGIGPSLTNLTVIADAGGTDQAYLADADNTEQVLQAFRAVRLAAQLPCDLPLDASAAEADNLDLTEVAFMDAECVRQDVPMVSDETECGSEAGWYFDDGEAPTKIHLCEDTCVNVKSVGRQLYFALGCPITVVPK